MSLEPFSVFAAYNPDELESLDAELLSLIAADDDDNSPFPMELERSEKAFVDDFTPLKLTSTPTAVDALNPGFSRTEVQDLMNLLAPEPLKIPTFVRSYSEPIPKIGKRTKKCTYAARRVRVDVSLTCDYGKDSDTDFYLCCCFRAYRERWHFSAKSR